jgi:hypothetical protein
MSLTAAHAVSASQRIAMLADSVVTDDCSGIGVLGSAGGVS